MGKVLCLFDFFYYTNCSQIPFILTSYLSILFWLKLMISRELQCSLVLPLPPPSQLQSQEEFQEAIKRQMEEQMRVYHQMQSQSKMFTEMQALQFQQMADRQREVGEGRGRGRGRGRGK